MLVQESESKCSMQTVFPLAQKSAMSFLATKKTGSLRSFVRKFKSTLQNKDNRCKMNHAVETIHPNELTERIQTELVSSHQEEKSNKKFTVAVEGNIGCGKTTLLKYFSKFRDVEVLDEPVNKWRNVQGHNLLGLMYQDPQRWSLTLQTYVQLTMVQSHTQKQVAPVRLMERSLYSAKYCFVEHLYNTGKMPEAEYIVLTEWFNWLLKNTNISVDLVVYLRSDPKVLQKRIQSRCRPEEQAIPLEYLQGLHQYHEDWLISHKHFSTPSPILVLDANSELETMYQLYEEHSQHILCSGSAT